MISNLGREVTEEERQKHLEFGDEEYIFTDDKGNILSTQFLYYVWEVIDDICLVFSKYLNCNLINIKTGKLLCDEWYYSIGNLYDGYRIVSKTNSSARLDCIPPHLIQTEDVTDREFNFMSLDGKLLSDKWFYSVTNFHSGIAIVDLNDIELYLINTKGNVMNCTDKDLDDYYNFFYGKLVIDSNAI